MITKMVSARKLYRIYISFLFVLVTCNALGEKYTLYRLIALSTRDRQLLYIIHSIFPHFNFLNGITNEAAIPMHVAVMDSYVDTFEILINQSDCLFTKYMDYEFIPEPACCGMVDDDSIVFNYFIPYKTILELYKFWELKYTDKITKIKIGTTYENNDIFVIKVINATPLSRKPALFMLGGEEGRDWMSTALILAFIKRALEKAQDHFGRLDAYFLPVLNPDGYIYSMEKDRFWVRNRRPLKPLKLCTPHSYDTGVNVERNWMYKVKYKHYCHKLYFGDKLEENETYALSNFLDLIAPQTLAFFNVKGFANLITTPFAQRDKTQINLKIIKQMLYHTREDVSAAFNKTYYSGTTSDLLFNYTGTCPDWVKRELNVPVVITLYLKHLNHAIPDNADIKPLFCEFAGAVDEILSLSINLYEPLFKSQSKLEVSIISILITIFSIFHIVSSLPMFIDTKQ